MRILYQFKSDGELLNLSDLPDRIEILRENEEPLVFKPCAVELQTMSNRLFETEQLLKNCIECSQSPELVKKIDDYFNRHR